MFAFALTSTISIHQLVNSSSHPIGVICRLFGIKFNTTSALFTHQLLTPPQIINSREGLF